MENKENAIYEMGKFDVAVIDAGHAGYEAGLAAARLGLKTVVFASTLMFPPGHSQLQSSFYGPG